MRTSKTTSCTKLVFFSKQNWLATCVRASEGVPPLSIWWMNSPADRVKIKLYSRWHVSTYVRHPIIIYDPVSVGGIFVHLNTEGGSVRRQFDATFLIEILPTNGGTFISQVS
jgi:hypothetical protein